jgi:UDP-N-acetylmuramyl pentapeptide phosphotransferase/UDP-N-acetylglucosamine-1-phosphate transferase
MQFFWLFCLFLISILLLNYIFIKKKFLLDEKKLTHKSFASKISVPISGGVLILFYILLFINSLKIKIFFILIFTLGVLSDLSLIQKPLKKLILQTIIILIFLKINNFFILTTDFFFIDYLIKNKTVSILFTCFCILVLINGSNFMDGVNTLVSGYYILVIINILHLISNNDASHNFFNLYYLLLVLFLFFIFNGLNYSYLGDSGTFILSFLVGYYLINLTLSKFNGPNYISPIYIILLLWYPDFEILFSIIRKILHKHDPSCPDNSHLHHLLFSYLNYKLKNRYNLNNTLTGILINLYNAIVFIIGTKFYYNKKYLALIIIFNIVFYIATYLFLKFILIKFNKSSNYTSSSSHS